MAGPIGSSEMHLKNVARVSNEAAKQCWIEHQTLGHVKEALRVTLAWKVTTVGAPRKHSTLQFMLRSFERHFNRLMDLEEAGGYMADICDAKPRLWHQAFKLIDQHHEFRRTIAELADELDQLAPADDKNLCQQCREISALLDRVDQHDSQEIAMMQDALLIDEGGEG